ncbi:rhomboid protease ROM10, putative [Plasmodium knowlesi strain H]|uniref:Rhomboid-like protease n=1 Tax=Plasmodium knowlesi (strain H) TaxID=5851 RepID=A0A1A7W0D7_PLAKH|nr:rhomboid protease ROM10, putative [Plasmodium knowlesi strain H]
MNFFSNASNNSKFSKSKDGSLLTCKYTMSFNKTFKKDIAFIQILFPSLTVKSITTSFFLLLYFAFFILNVCNFDRGAPLYLSEPVLKQYGMSRNSVTNNHQYYKLLTATFLHSNVWNLIVSRKIRSVKKTMLPLLHICRTALEGILTCEAIFFFFFKSLSPLQINAYYLMNIGIIVEKSYGKTHYMGIMILSALCGNLLLCATSNCGSVYMGISTILSGFMGLFLQEIVENYKKLTDRWSIIGNYVFALLSLYLTISMFSFNGNILGNLGGIFGGFCYPYLTKKDTFHGQEKKVRLTLAVLLTLLLSSTLISLIVAKC